MAKRDDDDDDGDNGDGDGGDDGDDDDYDVDGIGDGDGGARGDVDHQGRTHVERRGAPLFLQESETLLGLTEWGKPPRQPLSERLETEKDLYKIHSSLPGKIANVFVISFVRKFFTDGFLILGEIFMTVAFRSLRC